MNQKVQIKVFNTSLDLKKYLKNGKVSVPELMKPTFANLININFATTIMDSWEMDIATQCNKKYVLIDKTKSKSKKLKIFFKNFKNNIVNSEMENFWLLKQF